MDKNAERIYRIPPIMTGGRSYEELRDRFLELLNSDTGPAQIHRYSTPGIYDADRVAYIIPPVTSVDQRDTWNPSNIYIVKEGVVAIGKVFYTKSSGEYLVEELILNRGDIFGEFEVPLSILGSTAFWNTKLPPRFNMTYGAWASGAALNWSMAYPRYITRDSTVKENAQVASHPFYIKSKNIRPMTDAEIFIVPIGHFEKVVSASPEAMTWFLMNVLWKNRLYFEPPSEGYGRSPSDSIARLFIRILAYRIRLNLIVKNEREGKTSCRTFIGPTEWIKYGLGSFSANLMDVVHSAGGMSRDPLNLDVFNDELGDNLDITYHYPVKNLDDELLKAMGCTPAVDRKEGRYGLLTGILMELKDLDFFKQYLLEKGE
ncbi:MAG: hypothetical protein WCU00_09395 [Candidatus Latescibacterota bacterium]